MDFADSALRRANATMAITRRTVVQLRTNCGALWPESKTGKLMDRWQSDYYCNERPGALTYLALNVPGVDEHEFGVYMYEIKGDVGFPARRGWNLTVMNEYDCAHWMMRDLMSGNHLRGEEDCFKDERVVLYDATGPSQEDLVENLRAWLRGY